MFSPIQDRSKVYEGWGLWKRHVMYSKIYLYATGYVIKIISVIQIN